MLYSLTIHFQGFLLLDNTVIYMFVKGDFYSRQSHLQHDLHSALSYTSRPSIIHQRNLLFPFVLSHNSDLYIDS